MEQKPENTTEKDSVKKTEAAEGTSQPKKKNIIQVFRPQNSKTGMVKPGGRPKTQNQGQRKPQSQTGARTQGTGGTRNQAQSADRVQNIAANRTSAESTRTQNDNRTQETRTAGGQGGNRSQNTNGQNRNQNSRYQNDGQNRNQGSRFQNDGQGRSQGGRYQNDGQGRSQGGRYQNDGQGRSQGGRFQNDGQGRSQGGRFQNDGQGRSQGGRFQNDGQGRSQGGRFQNDGQNKDQNSGSRFQGNGQNRNQNGRGSNGTKPAAESKPLEKESRKRTERGDRNRSDKGEKLERMEKNARQNQKNNGRRNQPQKAPAPQPVQKPEETIRNITIPEKLTVSELADAMKVQASAVIKKLFLQGTMLTVNQEIDFDTAEEIALEFNCICEKEVKVDVLEELLKEEEESEDTMVPRSPVVCVMGHVDHGKTSLLDAIRNTHVIDREAGGITQHIGASVVSINGQKITFLDTPGHEAFTAMRMRGANSTDIAILVVAADDGVMPQTIEAINHAKAAGIEIIVAINKMDKPSANVERVKQELTEYELIPEDWGGSTIMVPVSAHTHEGIDTLLEMILLTAEVLELKANPNRKARGVVIEAKLDKGKGPVATVLVQKGTLRVGEPVAAGSCYGKVRAMMDDKGRHVKEAGPSTPVEILGLSDVPNAGEVLIAMENEKDARSFAETFISEGRERMLEDTRQRMSLDDLFSQIQAGNLKELNLIVKADVQGSVEAVKQSLLKLSNEEVVVKVIHGGVGAINESDVILASASNAIIIGFNVRPDVVAKATIDRENVDVRLYRVIYDAIADVEAAMKGMLDPIFEEKVIGHAEVRQTFKASGVGTIAGSYVLDGFFQRGCSARITREGKEIFNGALASLKRFKDDVKEVKAGYECGLVFEKFNDIHEEDQIEAYIMVEVPR
jgi:translation initiation factor IF-2